MIYYDTLQCAECFYCGYLLPDYNDNNVSSIDGDIVLNNFKKKIALATKYNNITGSIYHPITGEYIEDFKSWVG